MFIIISLMLLAKEKKNSPNKVQPLIGKYIHAWREIETSNILKPRSYK